jgi:hypothetical protein
MAACRALVTDCSLVKMIERDIKILRGCGGTRVPVRFFLWVYGPRFGQNRHLSIGNGRDPAEMVRFRSGMNHGSYSPSRCGCGLEHRRGSQSYRQRSPKAAVDVLVVVVLSSAGRKTKMKSSPPRQRNSKCCWAGCWVGQSGLRPDWLFSFFDFFSSFLFFLFSILWF